MHPWQNEEAGNVFALSWSVNALGPALESLSDVTPVTLGNDPTAHTIRPADLATKSLPPPEVKELSPET
jgi:hypothetical protein